MQINKPYPEGDSNAAQMLGTVLLFIAAIALAFVGACTARAETIHASIRPDGNGGVYAQAGVDVYGVSRMARVQRAAWYAKPFVAVSEVTKHSLNYAVEHPYKTTATLFTAYLAYRAIDGKLDDDAQRTIDWARGKRDKDETPQVPAGFSGWYVSTAGDNSPVTVETRSDNVIIQTQGNNSPVNVKIPPPEE
jgi:hypothetical protein